MASHSTADVVNGLDDFTASNTLGDGVLPERRLFHSTWESHGVFMRELAELGEVVAVPIQQVSKTPSLAAGFLAVHVNTSVITRAGCRIVKGGNRRQVSRTQPEHRAGQ